MATIKDLQKAYEPYGLETINESEEDRFEHIKMYDCPLRVELGTFTDLCAVSKQEGKAHQRKSEQQKVWRGCCLFLDGC
jgi:hypothetical protein